MPIVFYRRDLIEHFDWLAESKYLEEFCDEALVAVSMTGLRDFVDRLREEDPMCPNDLDVAR